MLLIQVVPTVVVFLVLFTFAIVSWRSAAATLRTQENQTINEEMAILEDAIQTRLHTSQVLLSAGVGLFDGSEAVSREEWGRFFEKFNIPERFIGVSTVGYVPIVRHADRAMFEATVKGEGYADFTIRPPGDRSVYAPVMYDERYTSSAASSLGYDEYSDPVRRRAMEAAAASGNIVMTDKLQFADGIDGVILYMPVYARGVTFTSVDDRQAALRGYVYVSLRLKELFADISASGHNFYFVVTDDKRKDGKTHEVFNSLDTQSKTKQQYRQVSTSTIKIYGQDWKITLLSNGNIVSETDAQRPSTILTAGVAMSLIASVAVYLLIQYRTRSFALAEERKLQQAKDELLSLASHQLRTPATGVKQYIGMVLDGFGGKVPKDQARLLEQAYKSNERQLQIINEFLYVAKLGSGSLTTTRHKFDLTYVIKEVIEEMDIEIKEKGHNLEVYTPRKNIIEADEHSIRMIIENLLSNAIKYTPDNGNVVVVLRSTKDEIQVEVKDDGIGIAKKDIPLLFKQFSRIPNELSANVSGSGIGLYLSQQLAERNGGYISVTSEPKKGSIFTLHLPIKSVKNFTKHSKKA